MNVINDKQVRAKTGLSRSTRDRLVRQGRFPAPIQLTDHGVGYIESEVNEWLASRARGALAPPVAQRMARVRRAAGNPTALRAILDAESQR